jgi:hypothetical protein
VIRVVSAVNHDLHGTANGGYDRLPTLLSGWGDYEAAWIADPAHPAPVSTVTLDAEQDLPAIGTPAWYDVV